MIPCHSVFSLDVADDWLVGGVSSQLTPDHRDDPRNPSAILVARDLLQAKVGQLDG